MALVADGEARLAAGGWLVGEIAWLMAKGEGLRLRGRIPLRTFGDVDETVDGQIGQDLCGVATGPSDLEPFHFLCLPQTNFCAKWIGTETTPVPHCVVDRSRGSIVDDIQA